MFSNWKNKTYMYTTNKQLGSNDVLDSNDFYINWSVSRVLLY